MKKDRLGRFIKTRFDRFCLECKKPLSGYKSIRCGKCGAMERLKKFEMCKHNKKHSEKSKSKISKNRKGKGKHIGITYNIKFNINNLEQALDRKTIRKILLDKNSKCDMCGLANKLQIHHIDKNINNNKINNLRILCSKCHLGIHKNWLKRKY